MTIIYYRHFWVIYKHSESKAHSLISQLPIYYLKKHLLFMVIRF